jgi:hypothetical protein
MGDGDLSSEGAPVTTHFQNQWDQGEGTEGKGEEAVERGGIDSFNLLVSIFFDPLLQPTANTLSLLFWSTYFLSPVELGSGSLSTLYSCVLFASRNPELRSLVQVSLPHKLMVGDSHREPQKEYISERCDS